jgi:hypothetical protein
MQARMLEDAKKKLMPLVDRLNNKDTVLEGHLTELQHALHCVFHHT